jgi:RNA polymerase sigma factor (sigma-70 family)
MVFFLIEDTPKRVARRILLECFNRYIVSPKVKYYSKLHQLLVNFNDTGWDSPMEEPLSHNDTAADRVQLILQALPEQYREVVTCRFLLDLSIRETAQRMGLPVANVKVKQFRALKRAAKIDTSLASLASL